MIAIFQCQLTEDGKCTGDSRVFLGERDDVPEIDLRRGMAIVYEGSPGVIENFNLSLSNSVGDISDGMIAGAILWAINAMLSEQSMPFKKIKDFTEEDRKQYKWYMEWNEIRDMLSERHPFWGDATALLSVINLLKKITVNG